MLFFDAAANWADRQGVDLCFMRDEFDGWFANLRFSDAKGTYSAQVNAVAPKPKKSARKKDGVLVREAVPGETFDEFEIRVGRLLDKASAGARAARIKSINKIDQIAARDRARREALKREYA